MSQQQQWINSKGSVSIYAGPVNSMNDEVYVNDDFTSPSLVGNFSEKFLVGIGASYKFNDLIGANLKLNYVKFSGWNYNSATVYSGANFSILSFSPQVAFGTPFREEGILNRLRFSVFGGPSFNVNAIFLDKPLYTTVVGYTTTTLFGYDLKNSTTSAFGYSVGTGIDYAIAQRITLGLSYNLDNQSVTSERFGSPTIRYSSINFVLGIRGLYNKRYKYSPK